MTSAGNPRNEGAVILAIDRVVRCCSSDAGRPQDCPCDWSTTDVDNTPIPARWKAILVGYAMAFHRNGCFEASSLPARHSEVNGKILRTYLRGAQQAGKRTERVNRLRPYELRTEMATAEGDHSVSSVENRY